MIWQRLRRSCRPMQHSYPGCIEQIGRALDVEPLEMVEARLAYQAFGARRPQACTEAGAAVGQGLRHAMEDAEPVVDGSQCVLVVLEPVSRFRLYHEEDAILLEQAANLGQRRLRGGKVMDTVTCGDE